MTFPPGGGREGGDCGVGGAQRSTLRRMRFAADGSAADRGSFRASASSFRIRNGLAPKARQTALLGNTTIATKKGGRSPQNRTRPTKPQKPKKAGDEPDPDELPEPHRPAGDRWSRPPRGRIMRGGNDGNSGAIAHLICPIRAAQP